MTILSVSDIRLEYGTDIILQKINFSVNEGDRLGIVGVNGAGKSTLLRIIAGTTEPSGGNIFIAKGKSIGMLEQNAMLESDKTLIAEMESAFPECKRIETRLAKLQSEIEADTSASHGEAYERLISEFTNLTEKFKEIGGYEYQSRIRSMLTRFGFPESEQEKTIDTLSGGERTRLALVRLLLVEPDILILDEPTNHLDTDTLYWLEEHLRAYPKTLLLVSHDRYFLDRTATKILDIENTKAELYNGNYSAFATQKTEARKRLQKMYDLQQKEIARIEGIIQTQIHFGQEHNYITIASKKKQIEHMEKIDAPERAPGSIRLAFAEAAESGNDVLEADGLSKSFGNRRLFSDLSFMIKKRDHVIIMGPNGCGKSTLIKVLGGFTEADSGVIEYGTGVIAGYYDQEQQTLDENKTVLEELCSAHEKLTITQIRTALAGFLFFAEDIEKKVSVLSGGEKARLMLCKMILSKVNLLILDEPTNHLDIASREALENALLSFGGTIVAVSHDRYFMKKLATRIFDLSNGFYDYHGSFDEYLEFKENHRIAVQTAVKAEKQESEGKIKYNEAKKLTSEIRKAEKRIERAENEIECLEEEKSVLEEEMNSSAATDYVRLSEISERISEIDARIDALFSDMEEAEAFLAEYKNP
ncbi:MAG: ABC-F family ATP-binding cassette domain-containing protein [Clostridia bacterium]|nr:ABC-F family ATP-binding cassette domain-containing protein [Clostridia bacterium]